MRIIRKCYRRLPQPAEVGLAIFWRSGRVILASYRVEPVLWPSTPTARKDRPINVPVLIVGAGPTGLVLALWLTRLGVAVRIIDKTAEPGTTSRALAVQVRTLEFYDQMGIAEAVVDGGVKIAGVNLWVKGSQAARLPLQNIGQSLTPFPFVLVFPQDAHERLLIERLGDLGVNVERRTELLRFDQDPERIRAVLKRPDGSEEVCQAAYLAGCDGASSIVRESLAIGFPGGTYAGHFLRRRRRGQRTGDQLRTARRSGRSRSADRLSDEGTGMRPPGRITCGEEPAEGGRELTFDDVSRVRSSI